MVEPSSGLTFVTVGPREVRQRKTSRSLVRSHAMSKVWEERKEKNAKNSKDHPPDAVENDREGLAVRLLARRSSALRQSRARGHRSQEPDFCSRRASRIDTRGWVEADLSDALAHSGIFGVTSPPCSCDGCRSLATWRSWSASPYNSDSENSTVPVYESPNSLGLDQLDPFSTTAFALDRHACRYIKYYLDNMTWKLTMPKNKWLNAAITDGALLHATIFHSAAHFHRSTNKRMGQESFNHFGLAIRMVRERLQDPQQATSEGTIGTIARMVTGYAIYGPHDTWMQHTQGLEDMVRIRGGLDQSGFGKYLQHALVSNSLCGAAVVGYKIPTAFRQEYDMSVSPASEIFPEMVLPLRPHGKAFMPLVGPRGISQELVDVCNYFGDLSRLLETIKVWTEDEQFSYSEASNKVMQRLIDLEQSEHEAQELGLSSRTYHLREGTRMAIALYLYAVVREVPPNGIPYITALKTLRGHLSKTNLEDAWIPERQSHLLLWILFLAASSAVNENERKWYSLWIGNVIRRLGVKTWEQVKNIFAGFVWMDEMLDRKCVPLWEENCLPIRIHSSSI